MWDDEIEPVLLSLLQLGYLRRKRWEARLQASQIVRALTQALGDEEGAQASASLTGRYRVVSAEQLMLTMGATWH